MRWAGTHLSGLGYSSGSVSNADSFRSTALDARAATPIAAGSAGDGGGDDSSPSAAVESALDESSSVGAAEAFHCIMLANEARRFSASAGVVSADVGSTADGTAAEDTAAVGTAAEAVDDGNDGGSGAERVDGDVNVSTRSVEVVAAPPARDISMLANDARISCPGAATAAGSSTDGATMVVGLTALDALACWARVGLEFSGCACVVTPACAASAADSRPCNCAAAGDDCALAASASVRMPCRRSAVVG